MSKVVPDGQPSRMPAFAVGVELLQNYSTDVEENFLPLGVTPRINPRTYAFRCPESRFLNPTRKRIHRRSEPSRNAES